MKEKRKIMGNKLSCAQKGHIIAKVGSALEDSLPKNSCASKKKATGKHFLHKKLSSRLSSALKSSDTVLDILLASTRVARTGVFSRKTRTKSTLNKIVTAGVISSQQVMYDNTLFLCRKSVVEITEDISNLKNLVLFHACCNYILKLPVQIGYLRRLRILMLGNNRIHALPSEIGECSDLREISFCQNFLSELPASFRKLKKLETLDISANRFRKVPICVADLISLKKLDVSRNRIRAIPIEILRLKKLLKIHFYGNSLMYKEQIKCQNEVATLKELCARKITTSHIAVLGLQQILADFVSRAKRCSVCKGPYYERVYKYTDVQTFLFDTFPVCYNMCSRHFVTKRDKIEQML